MSASDDARSSGELFAAFAVEQLAAEEGRRTSLESRGMTVITSSGTIAGLLLALAALVTDGDDFTLTGDVTPWFVAALAAFAIAALLGVAVNSPTRTSAIDPAALLEVAKQRWALPDDDARRTLLSTRVVDLTRVQRSNNVKGWLLLGATIAEALAICFLAVATAELLG